MSTGGARLFVSAAHKSSGKTTVSIGLCAALAARGLNVQPFKKGPDYIDPLWLSAAAGRACRNLDHNTMTPPEIRALFRRHAAGADIAVIEGNKGLHDGVDLEGTDSSAALAALLRAPVVLVIDACGITRGIAPLLLGLRNFAPRPRFAGVILNKVSGARHEAKLRAAIERYTDFTVLGALPRNDTLVIAERHIGLVPANEARGAGEQIARLGSAVAAGIDLDRLLEAARAVPPLRRRLHAPRGAAPLRWRVGVARDAAFGFYYADDLDMLLAEGFAVIPFDTLRDPHLPPDLDGLFIGGGFPEAQMDALETNASLRAAIRAAVTGGMPVYAECGGFMYLMQALVDIESRSWPMAGVFPTVARMQKRLAKLGYVEVEGARGHEFRYSTMDPMPETIRRAYAEPAEGYRVNSVLGSYIHLHFLSCPGFAGNFVQECATRRARK